MVNYVIIGAIVILAIILFVSLKGWIGIYNKFQYWIERVKRKFSDISIVMQERVDLLYALAQNAKKYDIHEHKALKDVTEARSRWTKDKDKGLNERVKSAEKIENSYFKLQAVFEKYPQLKSDKLHLSLMRKNERVESRLRKTRLDYNRVAQKYNRRVKIFPRNIVAFFHGFKQYDYLEFKEQETFKPKEMFND